MHEPSLPFLNAAFAAILWAFSAPIISYALSQSRQIKNSQQVLLSGLTYSLVSGSVFLTVLVGPPELAVMLDPFVILAGILTFLLGSGLYYFSSVSNSVNAGVAAQYANMKPLITIFIGVVVFLEPMSEIKWISVSLIALGVLVIIVGATRNKVTWEAVILGVLLAVSWALGEVFVSVATVEFSPARVTQGALISATVIMLAVSPFSKLWLGWKFPTALPLKVLVPFVLHGTLSFCLAYLFFFSSIANIGLSDTILFTVFWPTLAFILTAIFSKRRLFDTAFEMYLAMVFFTAGSVLYMVGKW